MLALSLMVALACSGESRAAGYPRETIDAFIASCQGNEPLNADREAYCRCMMGVLQSRVPYFRFAEWERRVRAGETVPELQEAFEAAHQECRPPQ